MSRERFLAIAGLACAGLVFVSCGPLQRPTKVTVNIVNDQPASTARISYSFGVGGNVEVSIQIDATGKGTHTQDVGGEFDVFTRVICGGIPSGRIAPIIEEFFLNPKTQPSKTVNCQVTIPMQSSVGCQSYHDSLRGIDLFENPEPYPFATCNQYAGNFTLETTRDSFARAFLSTHQIHERGANLLHQWLLNSTPPDSTVVQNLDAGASLESQIALVVGGPQFFAQSNNDNAIFVTHAYKVLLQREPTQWELDAAVEELNGYWVWVDEPCPPPLCFIDMPCEPAPSEGCGHWEWRQKTREELAWELTSTHEFHQVAATITLYGVELRREASSTEIENLAYHMDSLLSVREGLITVVRSQEFFEKSTRSW